MLCQNQRRYWMTRRFISGLTAGISGPYIRRTAKWLGSIRLAGTPKEKAFFPHLRFTGIWFISALTTGMFMRWIPRPASKNGCLWKPIGWALLPQSRRILVCFLSVWTSVFGIKKGEL